jgi:hypothetical protein
MQHVYEFATVNISADAAPDSTAGLGSSKQLADGVAVGNTTGGDVVYVKPMFDTDSSGVSHVPIPERYLRHILDTRACVLQERMLSPRVLHFSQYEMAWECNTSCAVHAQFDLENPLPEHLAMFSSNRLP